MLVYLYNMKVTLSVDSCNAVVRINNCLMLFPVALFHGVLCSFRATDILQMHHNAVNNYQETFYDKCLVL